MKNFFFNKKVKKNIQNYIREWVLFVFNINSTFFKLVKIMLILLSIYQRRRFKWVQILEIEEKLVLYFFLKTLMKLYISGSNVAR